MKAQGNTDLRSPDAYERFGRATDVPMLLLALAVIPLMLVPFLAELPAGAEHALRAADAVIWMAFAFELTLKTYLAPDRRRHLRAHWLDVLMVLVPFLRPLRLVRSGRVLAALRGTHVAAAARRER